MHVRPRALLLIHLLALLSACGSHPESGALHTDDLGRTVIIPEQVQRIVTLAPNITEIVFAAGAGNRLVAVSSADDYPQEVEALPRISVLPLDFEALISASPDLVLAGAEYNSVRDAGPLEDAGIPMFFLGFSGVDDILDAIEVVGTLAGTGVEARATADSLRHRLEELRIEVSDGSRPRVVFLIGVETLYSFGGDSYVNEMIRLAGGISVTETLSSRAPVLSDEFILEHAPDVILGTFGAEITPAVLRARRPAWAAVPAVRSGRVYAVDPDLVLRPGPRVVEGVEEMRQLFQSETAR